MVCLTVVIAGTAGAVMAKKNFRKIPSNITASLLRINGAVLVATVRNIERDQLAAGAFTHLGLTSSFSEASTTIPSLDRGRYSRWNIEGRTIVRRDLPKFDKVFTFDVPCFGNWSNMVTVTQTRSVYPREILAPQQLTIRTEILAPRIDGGCRKILCGDDAGSSG